MIDQRSSHITKSNSPRDVTLQPRSSDTWECVFVQSGLSDDVTAVAPLSDGSHNGLLCSPQENKARK